MAEKNKKDNQKSKKKHKWIGIILITLLLLFIGFAGYYLERDLEPVPENQIEDSEIVEEDQRSSEQQSNQETQQNEETEQQIELNEQQPEQETEETVKEENAKSEQQNDELSNKSITEGHHINYLMKIVNNGLSILSNRPKIGGVSSSELEDLKEYKGLVEVNLGLDENESPLKIRLNDLNEFDSNHIAIAGMTGSGKTQLIKDILYQIKLQVDDNLNFIFFDYKGEQKEKIEAKAEEIERLIARQADYNRIKRKLEYLRNSHKRYVEQIDSLFTVNRQLKEENKDIRQKFEVSRKEKEQVAEQKEELEKKVDMGAMLKAYNINVDAIHMGGWTGDKEKITDKARRLDKIKICFTVSENLLAEPGERTIYIRIARPDNKILYKRNDDFFMYNEEKMQYSLKKTIDYQNEKQDHCLYWEKDENVKEVMEGTYHVGIFIDGQEVGQSNMKLD